MRRRGTTQAPVDDYHDTARSGQKKSRRCVRLATSAATAENTKFLSFAQAPTDRKEPAMTHSTATANVPPRFKPQYDTDGSLIFWGADLVVSEELEAEAVKYPAGPESTFYNLSLHIEEGTAEEIRAALDRICAWWTAQESHLDGTEASR